MDFPAIEIELATAVIYYYDIDIKNCVPEITTLAYQSNEDLFVIDNELKPNLYSSFERELQKELLYLKCEE